MSARSLLERVLTGEVSADDPQFQKALAEDALMRREYEALRHVQRSLDVAGNVERNELLEIPARRSEGDLGAVRNALGLNSHRNRRPLVLLGLAAAALVLIGLWGWQNLVESKPEPESFLGPEELQCVEPVGAWPGSQFRQFRWHPGSHEAAWYELRVEGMNEEFSLHLDALTGTEWIPTAAQIVELPSVIRWEVRSYDASGVLLASHSVIANCDEP